MAEVLSQNEVDALLSAVDDGKLDLEETTIEEDDELSIYDFKRPERVSKEQIRSLETLHEIFARNLNASLSALMRTIVEVRLSSVEQLTYSEFIMSLPNPTCFNLLSARPLSGEIVLEINPSMVFPIIDKLLGGNVEESIPPDRPLTDIEIRIIDKISSQILNNLRDSWSNVTEINFVIEETESNPQLMQIVPPTEVVVLICFELRMGDASGMMNLCIPFTVIEPVMSSFSSQSWFGAEDQEKSPVGIERLETGIKKAPVESVVGLARTTITMKELRQLKIGSIITTPKEASSDLSLRIDGFPMFKGKPGVFRGRKALKVEGKTSLHAPY